MIVEYAQILSTVTGVGYKPTHKNHPCVKWAEIRKCNTDWLLSLLYECLEEYESRFDRKHKTSDISLNLAKIWYETYRGLLDGWTKNNIDYCFCMPDVYKSDNIVNSYRNYFLSEKLIDKNGKFIAKWTNREVPEWVANDERYLKFKNEVQNV